MAFFIFRMIAPLPAESLSTYLSSKWAAPPGCAPGGHYHVFSLNGKHDVELVTPRADFRPPVGGDGESSVEEED
jgi:hypothetical protein